MSRTKRGKSQRPKNYMKHQKWIKRKRLRNVPVEEKPVEKGFNDADMNL